MVRRIYMSRRRTSARARHSLEKPIPWLPIDSRIFPQIFRFGHVKGTARIFLQIEMILSVGVVIGTLLIVYLKLLY